MGDDSKNETKKIAGVLSQIVAWVVGLIVLYKMILLQAPPIVILLVSVAAGFAALGLTLLLFYLPSALTSSPSFKRVKEIEKHTDPESERELIAFLKDEDAKAAARAAKVLGDRKIQDAVDSLIPCLKSKDWRVRNAAARALGKIGSLKAIGPLIDAMLKQNVAVAAVALGEIGHPDAVPDLIQAMNRYRETDESVSSSETNFVANDAVHALGKLGDLRAVGPLIAKLNVKSEAGWGFRQNIAMALGSLKSPRGVDPLIEALANWKGNPTPITNALKNITGQDFGQDVEKWKSWWHPQKDAALAEEMDDLITRFRQHDKIADEILVQIGKPSVPHLVKLLNDEDSEVVQNSMHALGKLNAKEAVPKLRELEKSTHKEICNEAQKVLKILSPEPETSLPAFRMWVKQMNPKEEYLIALLLRVCRQKPKEVPEEFRRYAAGDKTLTLRYSLHPNPNEGRCWVDFTLGQKPRAGPTPAATPTDSTRPSSGASDPVCPGCGTVYNRSVVISLLKQITPETFLFDTWSTSFKCKKCTQTIPISGVGNN